jgi:hypothetical protein
MGATAQGGHYVNGNSWSIHGNQWFSNGGSPGADNTVFVRIS